MYGFYKGYNHIIASEKNIVSPTTECNPGHSGPIKAETIAIPMIAQKRELVNPGRGVSHIHKPKP